MSAVENPDRRSDGDGNLERYSRVLAAWWREIVFGALLSAAVGGGGGLALRVVSPMHEASAHVAIIPSRTTVSIDEKFDTINPAFPVRSKALEDGKRSSLVGLALSGDIARKVADRLGKGRYSVPGELIKAISAEMVTIGPVTASNRNPSDLVRVSAKADSPENAVDIANAWSEEYVVMVNRLYEDVSQSTIDSIQAQIKKAEKDYGEIQAEVEMHLSSNDIPNLKRRIDMNKDDIKNYQSILQYTKSTLFSTKIMKDLDSLDRYHRIQERMDMLLNSAKGLRRQIEAQGESGVPSNDMALQLLKVQIYALEGATPKGLEVALNDTDTSYTSTMASQRNDINAIIDSLTNQIMQVDMDIDRIMDAASNRLLKTRDTTGTDSRTGSPAGQESGMSSLERLEDYMNAGSLPLQRLIRELEEDNKSLRAKMESTTSRREALVDERDRRWSAVQILRNEASELELAASVAPSEVRLASSAIVLRNVWPHPALVATVIGVAWIPVAAFLALFMNSLGIRPFLERRGT